MGRISIEIPVKDFHLDHIFDCGQCFRWTRQADGSYVGIAGGRPARMHFRPADLSGTGRAPEPGKISSPGRAPQPGKISSPGRAPEPGKISGTEGILTIEGASEADFHEFWYDYLDLGRDYGKVKRSLGRGDAAMRRAIKAGAGIRILKQDLWETMVSFIISQNNNIPRIKGCIEALCRQFGEPVDVPDGLLDCSESGQDSKDPAGCGKVQRWYTIPGAEILGDLKREDLEGCRMGYRAPYLIETARQVLERGGMEEVERQIRAAEDPVSALQEFTGIGPKVAGCIALFGAGRTDAFPIDVWMRRAMHTVYGIDEKNLRQMQEYAAEHFGKYGGFAQQYLFYYIRGL